MSFQPVYNITLFWKKGDDAMAKTMIASEITAGQIENFADKLRAAIRKHCSEISSEVAQQVLGLENLGMEMFAIIRSHAERISKMIARRVKVDRTRTSQEALDATGRAQYTDKSVVATMPKGEGDEVEVVFFQPRPESFKNGLINNDQLEKEFEFFGLKPVDPISLAAVNEVDQSFADEHPNGTHWKNDEGEWCFIAFNRWDDEREVSVSRFDNAWFDGWWFAGLRK